MKCVINRDYFSRHNNVLMVRVRLDGKFEREGGMTWNEIAFLEKVAQHDDKL